MQAARLRLERLTRSSWDSLSTTSYSTPNEAVNFALGTVFVAVPKAGSTSVREQLRPEGRALVSHPHLNIQQLRSALYVFRLLQVLGSNERFPSAGQESDSEVRRRCDAEMASMFKFAAVRNPWARAVSLYSRREGVEVGGLMSFGDFCESHAHASDTCRQPTRHQSQLEWLTDDEGALGVDFVYQVERFAEAAAEIRERTNGRVALDVVALNRNPESGSADYRKWYTANTRDLIARRFAADIEAFGYDF